MYKNVVWFIAGYVSAKHIAPVIREVIIKQHARMQEEGKIKS